jgi:predicted nucleic acid-binding protein
MVQREAGKKPCMKFLKNFSGFSRFSRSMRIAHTLSGAGMHISSFDELIAAIAIRNNEPLVSRDGHFSHVEGLNIIPY